MKEVGYTASLEEVADALVINGAVVRAWVDPSTLVLHIVVVDELRGKERTPSTATREMPA